MGGPSRRGQSASDSSPGSRFSVLNILKDNEFPIPNRNTNKRSNQQYQSHSFFSKNSRLEDLKSGPKFIVMQRNEIDNTKTMQGVSPFTIQKCIELHAGQPKSVKLLRNGTLLIETVSNTQAEKLYKLNTLGSDICIKVSEHPTLNTSKGIFHCVDILCVPNETILSELKDQHVVDIVRIKKKHNGQLIDNGLFIVTFSLPSLPERLQLGFISCPVDMYIPNPRRCYNCQQFGHGANHCKKATICANCAEPNPDPDEKVCVKPKKCSNCNGDHPAWDRKCLIFIKEREIQQIQTTHKISNYQARQRYMASIPLNPSPQTSTYTDALMENKENTNTTVRSKPSLKSSLNTPSSSSTKYQTFSPNASKKKSALNISESMISNTFTFGADIHNDPTTTLNKISNTYLPKKPSINSDSNNCKQKPDIVVIDSTDILDDISDSSNNSKHISSPTKSSNLIKNSTEILILDNN